jgi:hypothetical protein
VKHISINLAPRLATELESKDQSLDAKAAAQDITLVTALALNQSTDLSWFDRVVLRKEAERVPFEKEALLFLKVSGARMTISAHHVKDGNDINVHVEINTPGGAYWKFVMTYQNGKRNPGTYGVCG